MPKLRWVTVWPPTGPTDRPWADDVDEDAFGRSARSVCELYSEALRGADVPARYGELRLVCRVDGQRSDVLVTVQSQVADGCERAVVLLPSGIALLPAPVRARLVLETVHAAALRLGRERGWNAAALTAAAEHTQAAGLRYRWRSPPKSSPDRRHTAHATFWLGDDGNGRAVVEMRRRADGVRVAMSESAPAYNTSTSFAHSARTLRWCGNDRVEMTPAAALPIGPGRAVLLADRQELITVGVGDGPVGEEPADFSGTEHGDMAAVPSVRVVADNETGSCVQVVGGCVERGVPDSYWTRLHHYLEQLTSSPWQAWWSAGGDGVLEIWYDTAGVTTGVTARRFTDGLRVRIRRPASTFASGAVDPAALARQDVDAMLSTVRRRAGLPAPPPLAPPQP